MEMSYKNLVRIKTIKKLPEIEKKAYLAFHEKIWKEDFETGKSLIKTSPRWAVISGYYAMHNLAKLLLAKKFNIKISGKFVHVATIEALRNFLKEKETVQKIEKACELIPIEELPEFLEAGKKERSKSQYYAGRLIEITSKNAEEFFKEIVEPFVKTIEGML
jgi:hypothetical protein